MNEQRQRAYLYLIERLLNSPSGEEPQILQANRELLDAGFLQMLDAVAQMLLQQGNENAANWLRNLAVELGEALNLSSPTVAKPSEEELQACWQFWMEVLLATAKSEGDGGVVYPLLAENTAYLNQTLAEVLRHWATTTLPERQPDEAQSIAAYIVNFSNLIGQFPLGNKASNMEIAIAGYEGVLTLFTRHGFPQQWATTQNNLGNAYSDRILGNKAQNIELAITAYTAALEVRTCNAFPQEWATTQHNLGTAYLHRIVGDKAQNIELAIKAFTAALEVYTRDTFPQEWATTQNNLGNAYSDRIKGDKAQNLEVAITSFTAALQVRTCDAFPQDWAATQNNLGATYSDRIKGDKAENLELAITAYTAALEIYTCNAFPQNHAGTLFNLGIAYQDAQQFTEAYTTFNHAIETVEFLRGDIVSGDESKRKQAEQWNELYRRMVEVCLELDNITEAIEYAERSKTRNLVELILERDLKTIFSSEVVIQLEQLRDEIASGQYQLQNGKAENPTALAQHLKQLRQQRNDLQNRHLPIGSGFKLDKFQATLDEHTTVVEWYITNTGFETFITTCDSLQRLKIANAAEQSDAFLDWFNEYLKAYYQTKAEWENSLASRQDSAFRGHPHASTQDLFSPSSCSP